jgi:hypothetical protein
MTRSTSRGALRRAWFLILGMLALACLIRLHALEEEHEKKGLKLEDGVIKRFGEDKSFAGTLVNAAIADLQKRKATTFANVDELYLAVDRALQISPPDGSQSVEDFARDELDHLLAASQTLAAEETAVITRLRQSGREAAEIKDDDDQLSSVLLRRQRVNQVYLLRVGALAEWDSFVRASVRRHFYATAGQAFADTPGPNEFTKQLLDHKHPLHLVFDLFWYASLLVTVICLGAFLVSAFFNVLGIPGISEAFEEKKKKLFDFGEGRGALAAAATVAVVGVGTIAGTVGSASSSPWMHSNLLAASIVGSEGNAGYGSVGLKGTPGDKGLAGDRGLPGDRGLMGDKGPDGGSGKVLHEVTIKVDPVKFESPKLDAIKVDPLKFDPLKLDPVTVRSQVSFDAPLKWDERIRNAESEAAAAKSSVQPAVNAAVNDAVTKISGEVTTTKTKQEHALKAAGRTQGRFLAMIPLFRDYYVGDYEISAIKDSQAIKDKNDRDTIVLALEKMREEAPEPRWQYGTFISLFREALFRAMPGRDAATVNGVADRNMNAVLAICQIPR